MALDYKKKSDYWDKKHKTATAPRPRKDRKRVEVSTSVPRDLLTVDDGEQVTLRTKSRYPHLAKKPEEGIISVKKRGVRPQTVRRREDFDVTPDIPEFEHKVDPIRAKERRKVSQKKLERQKRVKRGNVRTVIAIISAGVALAFLLGSLALFLRSPFFAISSYPVSGTESLTSATVLSYVQTDEDTSLLALNKKEVEQAIAVNPWIASAKIKKELPSTLQIHIEERIPAGIVEMVNGQRWVASTDGIWLGEVIPEGDDTYAVDPSGVHPQVPIRVADLIVIEDISPAENIYGAPINLEEVLNAIEILKLVEPEFSKLIKSISSPEISRTKITTKDNIEILFGSARDGQEKSRIALAILKEHKGQVTLINVRSVDNPALRGLDIEPDQ